MLGWCVMTETSKYGFDDKRVKWQSQELSPGATIQAFTGSPVRTKEVTLEKEYAASAAEVRNGNAVMLGNTWSNSYFIVNSPKEPVEKKETHVKLMWVPNKEACEDATLRTFERTKE